jgi:hypothetical protein
MSMSIRRGPHFRARSRPMAVSVARQPASSASGGSVVSMAAQALTNQSWSVSPQGGVR